ncbi:MAG: DNA polymerase III subunit epsilon [Gammaproteobacteria bacterium]|nr:DNA polymerase III subunit epsilon [Gammaproteobacteria bacterium]
MSRQIVLDTETTGLDPAAGHRIIEIGCVELRERRLTGENFHVYIKPEREIDAGALEVHGITNEFLADKPLFAAVQQRFLEFVDGAELIIHNAPFDVAFLDHELQLNGHDRPLAAYCKVTDSLALARKMYPGQRNSLDALCKRLEINNSHRTLHGALLDSEILADVYLRMTGGQTTLSLDVSGVDDPVSSGEDVSGVQPVEGLRVIAPDSDELAAHAVWLQRLQEQSESGSLWQVEAD